MKKIAIILLIISVLSLYVFSVSIFADRTITNFNPTYPDNFLNQAPLVFDERAISAAQIFATDGYEGSYEFVKQPELFDLSFISNNVRYSTQTLTFSTNNIREKELFDLVITFHTKYLFPDYNVNYFDKLEFYFVINVYAATPVEFTQKKFRATINGLMSSPNGGGLIGPDGSLIHNVQRELDVSLVAEGQLTSSKSKSLVYKASFNSAFYSEYFESGTGSIGIKPLGGYFVSNTDIIDIDIGFFSGNLASSFHKELIPWNPYPDIWDGIVDIPVIERPLSPSSTHYGIFYEVIKTLSLVKEVIVPLGALAISFFTFRIVLWKVV